jgi:hypothetical protein
MAPESFSDSDMRRLAERVKNEHDLRETEMRGLWEHMHGLDGEIGRLREGQHKLGERIVAEQLVQIYTERTEKLEEQLGKLEDRISGLDKRVAVIASTIGLIGAVASFLASHLFK